MEKQKHEPFQLGSNPMRETDFEKRLIQNEAEERKMARHKYVMGIQGRDGGCLPGEEVYHD